MPAEPPPKGNRHLHIGRYQILTRIASGGMGAVYKAIDLKRSREVALKVLTPEQVAAKPILLERFRLEARYGRRLNHENVVSVYGYGEHNGIYYLALEYVDGVDLHEYVNRKERLEVDESLSIMIQATRAIAHLNRHGIIHREHQAGQFHSDPATRTNAH